MSLGLLTVFGIESCDTKTPPSHSTLSHTVRSTANAHAPHTPASRLLFLKLYFVSMALPSSHNDALRLSSLISQQNRFIVLNLSEVL